MGCGSSRADESSIVTLCRERKQLIRSAADGRFAMAAAHANYFRSIAAISDAIQLFADEELDVAPSSPLITLPPTKKSSSSPSPSDESATPLSHSLSSGSHLHLSSESAAEESLKSSPRVSVSSTIRSPNYNFMRSSPAVPSMVYENPYPWDFGYNYPIGSPVRNPPAEVTPPPPPPAGSAWDFFNPFDSYEQYMPSYSQEMRSGSSTNSSEVREREGIPDLEEETEHEILKEPDKGKKLMDEDLKRKAFGEGTSNSVQQEEKVGGKDESFSEGSKERSIEEERGGSKDKEVILEEESSFMTEESRPSNVNVGEVARGSRDIVEVVKEINVLFKATVACGEEVSRMLEVGKVNYRARSRIYRGFWSQCVFLP